MNNVDYENIGRMMFGRFQWSIAKRLERCGYSDDLAYAERFERYFQEAFMAHWSEMRTIQTLFVLETSGLVSLESFKREMNY